MVNAKLLMWTWSNFSYPPESSLCLLPRREAIRFPHQGPSVYTVIILRGTKIHVREEKEKIWAGRVCRESGRREECRILILRRRDTLCWWPWSYGTRGRREEGTAFETPPTHKKYTHRRRSTQTKSFTLEFFPLFSTFSRFLPAFES